MDIKTLSDARAEMGRHRVSQKQLAPQLGMTESALSHVFNATDLVDLHEAGAARIADAIEVIAGGVVAA